MFGRYSTSPGLVVLVLFSGFTLAAADGYLGLQDRLVEIYDLRWDNVVRVKAGLRETSETGETQWTLRVGSGFFASADGTILATYRVVENAERLRYEYKGRTYEARLLGVDPVTNLALLEAVEKPPEIDFVPLTDSGLPRIGSFVVSISCALEFDPAPSIGLISGLESRFGSKIFPTRYLRASIPANPGEGGSPVFDLEGRFVGVLIASLPEVNSSYILPAKAVMRVRDALRREGGVGYGWIGIGVEQRTFDGNGVGLFVDTLDEGGGAVAAGIRIGDRLVSLDGETIRDVGDLRTRFFYSKIGETISLTVDRSGELKTFSVLVLNDPEEKG